MDGCSLTGLGRCHFTSAIAAVIRKSGQGVVELRGGSLFDQRKIAANEENRRTGGQQDRRRGAKEGESRCARDERQGGWREWIWMWMWMVDGGRGGGMMVDDDRW